MIFFFVLFILLTINSSEPLLVVYAALVLYFIYKLFWRPNDPKVIFFGLLLFWLSIIIKLFYSDIFGLSFKELSISPKIVTTAYIAMTALGVFSLGIAICLPKISLQQNKNLYETAIQYDQRKVFIVYIISFIIKTLLTTNLFTFSGLGEIFNALSNLRNSIIFVLIAVFYIKSGSLRIPLLLLTGEIILSFFSFFSNFKDVIFSFAVAFLFFPLKFTFKETVLGGVGLAATFYLLLTWQAIKGEYRTFLNGGIRSQAVVVDRGEALSKFFELAADAKINDPELWYQSVDRLSYIEFFSQASDNVPDVIPFEKGQIWKDNILHILVPRFLDPQKKIINDSEMVNKYCTKKVEGAEVGVSFSLGFLAESYIDYGYLIMFIPVFLLGLLMGFIYKFIITHSYNYMWGCGFVSPLWVYYNCNGTPGAKILGWMIVYVIIFFFVNKYLIRRLDNYLKVKESSAVNERHVLTYN